MNDTIRAQKYEGGDRPDRSLQVKAPGDRLKN